MMSSAEQAKELINTIQEEAVHKWGGTWMASLVHVYCEIESQETGQEVKPVQRRSQIKRTLDEGNPTLQTLLRLIKTVDMQLELIIVRKERKGLF